MAKTVRDRWRALPREVREAVDAALQWEHDMTSKLDDGGTEYKRALSVARSLLRQAALREKKR